MKLPFALAVVLVPLLVGCPQPPAEKKPAPKPVEAKKEEPPKPPAKAVPFELDKNPEKTAREKADKVSLNMLKGSGKDMTKPQRLAFHFISHEKAILEKIKGEAKALSCEVSNVKERKEGDRKYWFFDLVKSVLPTKKNVIEASAKMAAFADKHKVLYNGWMDADAKPQDPRKATQPKKSK